MEVSRIEGLNTLQVGIDPVTPTPQQRAEQQQLIHAAKAVNGAEIFGQHNELTFTFDRHSNRPILRVVNRETKEVVRQIPPEYLLRLAEDLDSF